jgi:hypothetical protein
MPLSTVASLLRAHGFDFATSESEAGLFLAAALHAGVVLVCREAALPGDIASLMLGKAPKQATPDPVATAPEKSKTVKNVAKAAVVGGASLLCGVPS